MIGWHCIVLQKRATRQPYKIINNSADVNLTADIARRKRYAQRKRGKTALHCASEKGHDAIVKILLDNRADVNTKTHYTQLTVRHCTRLHTEKCTSVVRLLLDKRLDINRERC